MWKGTNWKCSEARKNLLASDKMSWLVEMHPVQAALSGFTTDEVMVSGIN